MQKRTKRESKLSKVEIDKLFFVSGYDPIGLRDRAMTSMLFKLKITVSEAFILEIGDVLPNKREIRLYDVKTGKFRIVKIDDHSLINIRDYINYARPSLLRFNPTEKSFFVSTSGKKLQKESIQKRILYLRRKAAKVKKLPNVYERYLV